MVPLTVQLSKTQNYGYAVFRFLLRTSLNKVLKQCSPSLAASHCMYLLVFKDLTHTSAPGPVYGFYVVLNECLGEYYLSFSQRDLHLILSVSLSSLWL